MCSYPAKIGRSAKTPKKHLVEIARRKVQLPGDSELVLLVTVKTLCLFPLFSILVKPVSSISSVHILQKYPRFVFYRELVMLSSDFST